MLEPMTESSLRLSVRLQTPADWAKIRDLRLEMLADTPTAYLETLEDARSLSDEAWRERASKGAPRMSDAFALVDPDDNWLGQVRMQFNPWSNPPEVWVLAVYLTPAVRGTGAAQLLMRIAERWALALDQHTLMLGVSDHNPRAIAFYEREGWVRTGATRPYAPDPTHRTIEMTKHIDAPPA